MSRSNGRLEPEVIVNYSDGFAYSKYKMEEAFRTGGFLDKPAAKPLAAAAAIISHSVSGKGDSSLPPLKREDIDVIVHEFEIPRVQAERVLVENGADLGKALRALVATP
ncbi:hypothetical protein BYT27DRAFT_7069156, partial [Phlegmacium glaucopus]